jgi:hypothetical protein
VQVKQGSWSVAQILEHLNSYGRYYLPEIASVIAHAEKKNAQPSAIFHSGWLGDYFTRMMLPGKDGKIANRMQSPKNHRPPVGLNVNDVLDEWLQQQYQLLELLDRAKKINIGKARVPVSISRWIKLKLGDTFRFFIAHEQRHFVQADNTLKSLGATTDRYPVNLPAV